MTSTGHSVYSADDIKKELETYENWTAQLGQKYPNLHHEDHKRWRPRPRSRPVRVACVEFGSTNQVACRQGNGAADLRKFWDSPVLPATGNTPLRRLFILEEFDEEAKAAIGVRLEIDPQVFHRHSRTTFWEANAQHAGCTRALPSLNNPDRTWTLEYSQVLHLNIKPIKTDENWKQFTFRGVNNERHVATSRSGQDLDGMGALYSKISFWGNPTENQGWDAMLLVDEPLYATMYSGLNCPALATHHSPPEAFQGGPADFIPHASLTDALAAPSPPVTTSTFDTLVFYYFKHAATHLVTSPRPNSATLFAQKLVAAQYMLLIEYQRFLLMELRKPNLEDSASTTVESAWGNLQTFRRRLANHQRHVALATAALGLGSSANPSSQAYGDWRDTAVDFEHIAAELQRLSERAENLLGSFIGLASMVGNRQSLDEARSVRVLTVLGMTFLPLSLVASLLSMGGAFLPGEGMFWVYWAAALPFVLLVYAVSWAAVKWVWWEKWFAMAKHKH